MIVEKTSIIDGVRVVTLKDLVAIKLISGLRESGAQQGFGRRGGFDSRGAAG